MYEKSNKKSVKKLVGVCTVVIALVCCSISAYAANICTETVYGKLYQATMVEIEDPIDSEETVEYIETVEEAFKGFQVEEAEEMARSRAINWTIKNKYVMKSVEFSKTKGSSIDVAVCIDPSDRQVTVGIIRPDGKAQYIYGKGAISHSFKVEETGKYRVYITNNSGVDVTATGAYN